MKYKRSLIFICLIISLFSIASVCASDVNQTVVAGDEINQELNSCNVDSVYSTSNADSQDFIETASEKKDTLNLNDDDLLRENKTGTVIVADDFTTVYNSGDYLKVTLKDNHNNPISGVALNVSLNGNKICKVTDDDGQIEILTTGLAAKTYDVNINFEGDDTYVNSDAAVKITVNKANSTLLCKENVVFDYGSKASISVSGEGATGFTVKFADEEVPIEDLKIIIPQLPAGTHKLYATTIPDDNHTSVTKTITLTINKIKSSFGLKDINLSYGDSSIVKILPKGATDITAKIDGKDVSVKWGDISISGLDAGTHTLSVTAIGDENHTSLTKNATITVKKVNSAIRIVDYIVDYGSPFDYRVSSIGIIKLTAKIDGKNVEVEDDLIKIPKLDAGTYTLTVTTVPDDNHYSITETAKITVNKVDYQFNIHDFEFSYGTQSEFTIETQDSVEFIAQIDGKEVAVIDNLIIFPKLDVGTHTLTVYTVKDANHNQISKTATITVSKAKTSVVVHNLNATIGQKINLTAGIGSVEQINDGLVRFFEGENKLGQVYARDGIAKLSYTPLKTGIHTISVFYDGTSKYEPSSSTFKLTVLEKSNPSSSNSTTGNKTSWSNSTGTEDSIMIIPSDSDVNMGVKLPEDATGTVTFTINGKSYNYTIKNGVAAITVPELDDGNYSYTVTYLGNDKYPPVSRNGSLVISDSAKSKVDPKITASDFKVTYATGKYYTIKVYGTDGKLANGAKVVITVKGKTFKTLTTTNGIAKFKVTNVPGTYKMNIAALGKSVTKTLTVKHLVTLKTVTVKKSAKKLVLQANLGKVNGKYLNKKTVTFKFNGKIYKAKTTSKGVAKVTIKSSVLKKLKVGKKITYQATYGKDTVKKTVKVKK